MGLQENRIAMVSPLQNAYSETFIQAQKNGVKGTVFYYFGGLLPQYLEGYGKLNNRSITWSIKIKRKLGFKTFNPEEAIFIHSLKKNKIQVVMAQYGTTSNRIVSICKKINIPLITHFHGYDASITTVIESCNKYEEVFNYSTYIMAVSRSMQKRLIELGCPSEKVIYNPYGPDVSFLKLEPQFSENTFIGLGRFVEKKAPYYTILAFKKVLEQFPDAKLVIGGQGNLFEVCQNLVRYHKMEANVILPGVLTKDAFLEYLKKSLAFVQHSVTALNGDQEGTPVAIMEASAAGLPVIATLHAGIPDVIIDGTTGFLVDEHDVDGMAEKMTLLLENKALAKQLGNSGKERMKSHFSLQKHLDVIDDLVEKTIRSNE
jgi:glycosyltransferase involved in cell wall biosynthesis